MRKIEYVEVQENKTEVTGEETEESEGEIEDSEV